MATERLLRDHDGHKVREIWQVTLTGQTEVHVSSAFTKLTSWHCAYMASAGTVPTFLKYVRPSTTDGSCYVWCSDPSITDDILVFLYGVG